MLDGFQSGRIIRSSSEAKQQNKRFRNAL